MKRVVVFRNFPETGVPEHFSDAGGITFATAQVGDVAGLPGNACLPQGLGDGPWAEQGLDLARTTP